MIEAYGEIFLTRVYTDREILYCQGRKRAMEHFAGRWAAKEAILKCLGSGWRRGLAWTDMEIRNDPAGLPRVLLCGGVKDLAQTLRISDILISISHCRAYATAYALAVRGTTPPPSDGGPPQVPE
jgi:holo-[acyl-carrier protein] synthase